MRDIVRTSSRYRDLLPIGRGGMAEVILALMNAGPGLSKVVVLKRIWPDLASDPEFLTMFRDEARLAIRLSHPNVVQTHEVIEEAGELAIAMEYLHGQPLTSVLNRLGGPAELSLALRLRILVEVLAGLHYAHELTDYDGTALGVVHRDVSPHNVFITYDGQVKLMDFGVAKTKTAVHRTRPGAIKGKVSYMAPEHLRHGAVDRRADVFAAGVILWELLAGRRLWHGMPEAQIVHHLAAGMAIPELPADFSRPPLLDAICARALALDPEERYPTAAELQIDLETVLVGAADSHARTLGRIVSHAFEAARAEWESLIARAVGTGSSVSLSPRWTEAIGALFPDPDPVDRTIADASIRREPAQPAPPRRGLRWTAIAGAAASAAALGLVMVAAPRAASRTSQPDTSSSVNAHPPPEPFEPVAAAVPRSPPVLFPFSASVAAPLEPRAGDRVRRKANKAAEARSRGRSRATREWATTVSGPQDEPGLEDLPRPASLRTIDEGDPFR